MCTNKAGSTSLIRFTDSETSHFTDMGSDERPDIRGC